MDRRIVGLILVGGQSSRMGFDKAQLFTCELYQKLKTVLGEVAFSINTRQSQEVFYQDKCVVIDDLLEGPMSGIYTALKALASSLLVLACDMPFIEEDLLRFLLEKRDKEATIFECDGFIQPLLGVYELSLLKPLEEQLQNKEQGRSLYQFLRRRDVNFLSLPSQHSWVFTNVNTRQDLLKCQKNFGRKNR